MVWGSGLLWGFGVLGSGFGVLGLGLAILGFGLYLIMGLSNNRVIDKVTIRIFP